MGRTRERLTKWQHATSRPLWRWQRIARNAQPILAGERVPNQFGIAGSGLPDVERKLAGDLSPAEREGMLLSSFALFRYPSVLSASLA